MHCVCVCVPIYVFVWRQQQRSAARRRALVCSRKFSANSAYRTEFEPGPPIYRFSIVIEQNLRARAIAPERYQQQIKALYLFMECAQGKDKLIFYTRR